ncbi:hypothetical protein GGH94_006176, partial [Coemansia aciculifera]
ENKPATDAPNDWQQDMLNQLNTIRAKANKPPLVLDARLSKVAQQHSVYQSSISGITHNDVGGTLGARCTAAGLKWKSLGENVASTAPDIPSVLMVWANSPGHYANMIGDFKLVGFGQNNRYWTQNFAVLF